MKLRRATPAMPFSDEVAAILLAGWSAYPPGSSPDDPHSGSPGGFWDLALDGDQGIADRWRAYEPQLRRLAAAWGWEPTWRDADDEPLFYAESIARRLAKGQPT